MIRWMAVVAVCAAILAAAWGFGSRPQNASTPTLIAKGGSGRSKAVLLQGRRVASKLARLLTNPEKLALFEGAGFHRINIGDTVTALLTPAHALTPDVASLAVQNASAWASGSYKSTGDQGQLTISAEKHGALFVNFPTKKGRPVEVVISLTVVGGTKLEMMAGDQDIVVAPQHGGDIQLSCVINPTNDYGDSVAILTTSGMDWSFESAEVTF